MSMICGHLRKHIQAYRINFFTSILYFINLAESFSGVALDQAHERNNGLVKSDDGIIVITENETTLLGCMTSGLPICKLVQSYENSANHPTMQTSHHQDIQSAKKKSFCNM